MDDSKSDLEGLWGPVQNTQPKAKPEMKPPRVQEFDEVGRGYWHLDDLDTRSGSGGPSELRAIDNEKREISLKEGANLLSSLCADGFHRPVIDIDIPVRYVPSTTPGHGHLYIDRPMTAENFFDILDALAKAGVVESGFAKAARRRGAAYVRPEGVKKPSGAL